MYKRELHLLNYLFCHNDLQYLYKNNVFFMFTKTAIGGKN